MSTDLIHPPDLRCNNEHRPRLPATGPVAQIKIKRLSIEFLYQLRNCWREACLRKAERVLWDRYYALREREVKGLVIGLGDVVNRLVLISHRIGYCQGQTPLLGPRLLTGEPWDKRWQPWV